MFNWRSTDFATLKYVFIVVALLIIVSSSVFSWRLVKDISKTEEQKMALWAEATRRMATDSDNTDYSFLLRVIEDNNTIPCFIVDNGQNVVGYRNIDVPNLSGVELQRYWLKMMTKYADSHTPIAIEIDSTTCDYIFYDDSLLLKKLSYYPYVQWGVVVAFFFVLLFFFSSAKRAEQNRVWVGLSKETAHQLGTPISSLMAWTELLKANGVEPEIMPEIEKDVVRLQTIAERFSKVGSVPELKEVCLNDMLENAVGYMRKRVSSKVVIGCNYDSDSPYHVMACVSLFEWVVENLCKNAVDAMEGRGNININVFCESDIVVVDVNDTGKGIPKSKFKTVFKPGYTTKKRGWGLGLSLVKRIVEEFHHGKIYVRSSEVGVGTTFRIELKRINS